MNTYVVPSQLISFSVFEHDHPCPDKYYNVVVFHRGDGKTPITKTEDVKGDIYHTSTMVTSHGWENLISDVCSSIESKGFEENRFLVSTHNISEGEKQAVTYVWWPKVY